MADLGTLIGEIEREWDITVGSAFDGGTAAVVAQATTATGDPVVVKLALPGGFDGVSHFANEITTLRLFEGRGCVRVLRYDEPRRALLLERLGRRLVDLELPVERQLEIICETLKLMWRPAPPDSGLSTLAEKGPWLARFIERTWEKLDRPCSTRAVEQAAEFAERRAAAFDADTAVLLHGDAHQWNTLEDGAGFKFVDPDGVIGEREYDLAIPMREFTEELLVDDPLALGRDRAALLASLTGLDPEPIWEWGFVERMSTGLLCMTEDPKRVWGRDMLEVGDAWVRG